MNLELTEDEYIMLFDLIENIKDNNRKETHKLLDVIEENIETGANLDFVYKKLQELRGPDNICWDIWLKLIRMATDNPQIEYKLAKHWNTKHKRKINNIMSH